MAGPYTRDSCDFLKKIGNLGNIPENAILVRTDIVGLLPNILYKAGFNSLNMLKAREHKAVSTEDLIKTIRFALKNNYFEFNGNVKKQISGQQLVQSFHHLTRVYLMMNLKPSFHNPKKCNF